MLPQVRKMYHPNIDTVIQETKEGRLVPVFRELPADLDTPITLFLKLKNDSPCFLLESVERGEYQGRYSFIGTNPYLTMRTSSSEAVVSGKFETKKVALARFPQGPDPLHVIQSSLEQLPVAEVPGLPRFFGGAVGYLSYDAVHFFEKLDDCKSDELHLPESVFLFSDTIVIFDHLMHKIQVVSVVRPSNNSRDAYQRAIDNIEEVVELLRAPLSLDSHHSLPHKRTPKIESNVSQSKYAQMVRAAKEYILAGDAFQIVISQRLRRKTSADSFTIYRALRMLNPSPYMFYLNFGDFQLIGSSPETLVKLEEGVAETRPIAGTRPRGSDKEQDKSLELELLADPKELAEHLMLVDLGRNDIGRVCDYGSVRLPTFMSVERFSHVMHIVSSVEGKLRNNYDAFSLMRASFPAGTVSGAPKIRAMDIITELENTRRGPYAGAVGYFGFGGNMDTCIAIRTIVMKDDTVYLQAGAGIVADSDPLREYQETLSKVKVMESAINLAENWKM